MARRLSKKEKGFVKDIVEGETGTQAALNNYDTTDYNTAAVIASENLTKPKIIQAIEEALPDELLNQVHLDGLKASKTVFSKEGEMMGYDEDFGVRAKYLDMAYKRRGLYAAEKHINLNLNEESSQRTEELANRLERLLGR